MQEARLGAHAGMRGGLGFGGLHEEIVQGLLQGRIFMREAFPGAFPHGAHRFLVLQGVQQGMRDFGGGP
jgi:hypothetical protein